MPFDPSGIAPEFPHDDDAEGARRDEGDTDGRDWKAAAFCRSADLAGLAPRRLPRPSDFKPEIAGDIPHSH